MVAPFCSSIPLAPAWHSLVLSLYSPSVGIHSSAFLCPSSCGVAVQLRPVIFRNPPQWVPRVFSRLDPGGDPTAETALLRVAPVEQPGGQDVLAEDRSSEQRLHGVEKDTLHCGLS